MHLNADLGNLSPATERLMETGLSCSFLHASSLLLVHSVTTTWAKPMTLPEEGLGGGVVLDAHLTYAVEQSSLIIGNLLQLSRQVHHR